MFSLARTILLCWNGAAEFAGPDAASPGTVHGFGSFPVSTDTGTPQALSVSSPLAPQGISSTVQPWPRGQQASTVALVSASGPAPSRSCCHRQTFKLERKVTCLCHQRLQGVTKSFIYWPDWSRWTPQCATPLKGRGPCGIFTNFKTDVFGT